MNLLWIADFLFPLPARMKHVWPHCRDRRLEARVEDVAWLGEDKAKGSKVWKKRRQNSQDVAPVAFFVPPIQSFSVLHFLFPFLSCKDLEELGTSSLLG